MAIFQEFLAKYGFLKGVTATPLTLRVFLSLSATFEKMTGTPLTLEFTHSRYLDFWQSLSSRDFSAKIFNSERSREG